MITRRLFTASAAGLAAALAAGIAPAMAESKGLIGISMPTKSSTRWISDGESMVKEFTALGYETDLQYAEDDIPNQLAQIENMVTKGAKVLTGGERIGTQGNFFAPTVLSHVPLDADVVVNEPFGPIAAVRSFEKIEDAIAEANRLPFGLAIISMADSNGLSGSTKVRSQSSCSVKSDLNTRTKFSLIFPKASKKVSLATKSISDMVERRDSLALIKSSF